LIRARAADARTRSARDIQWAAELIQAGDPGLAELLLVYGAGRTDDAVAHFERRTG
jgi:hypothetical protein